MNEELVICNEFKTLDEAQNDFEKIVDGLIRLAKSGNNFTVTRNFHLDGTRDCYVRIVYKIAEQSWVERFYLTLNHDGQSSFITKLTKGEYISAN